MKIKFYLLLFFLMEISCSKSLLKNVLNFPRENHVSFLCLSNLFAIYDKVKYKKPILKNDVFRINYPTIQYIFSEKKNFIGCSIFFIFLTAITYFNQKKNAINNQEFKKKRIHR